MSNTPTPSPAMFAGRRPSGPAYRVFTVAPAYGGELVITDGAKVEAVAIKAANTSISAVIIGEEGRGRERAVLPCPAVPDGDRLMVASVGTSQSGKPRLNAAQGAPSPDAAIIVFRTPMGFRGGNAHTGESVGWKCRCSASGSDATPDTCPQCAASRTGYSGPLFHSFVRADRKDADHTVRVHVGRNGYELEVRLVGVDVCRNQRAPRLGCCHDHRRHRCAAISGDGIRF